METPDDFADGVTSVAKHGLLRIYDAHTGCANLSSVRVNFSFYLVAAHRVE